MEGVIGSGHCSIECQFSQHDPTKWRYPALSGYSPDADDPFLLGHTPHLWWVGRLVLDRLLPWRHLFGFRLRQRSRFANRPRWRLCWGGQRFRLYLDHSFGSTDVHCCKNLSSRVSKNRRRSAAGWSRTLMCPASPPDGAAGSLPANTPLTQEGSAL